MEAKACKEADRLTLPTPAAEFFDLGSEFQVEFLNRWFASVIGWWEKFAIQILRENRREHLHKLYRAEGRYPVRPANRFEGGGLVPCSYVPHVTYPCKHYHVCVRCGVSTLTAGVDPEPDPRTRFNPLTAAEDIVLPDRRRYTSEVLAVAEDCEA